MLVQELNGCFEVLLAMHNPGRSGRVGRAVSRSSTFCDQELALVNASIPHIFRIESAFFYPIDTNHRYTNCESREIMLHRLAVSFRYTFKIKFHLMETFIE